MVWALPEFPVQQDLSGSFPRPGVNPFHKEPWFLLVKVAIRSQDMDAYGTYVYLLKSLK